MSRAPSSILSYVPSTQDSPAVEIKSQRATRTRAELSQEILQDEIIYVKQIKGIMQVYFSFSYYRQKGFRRWSLLSNHVLPIVLYLYVRLSRFENPFNDIR